MLAIITIAINKRKNNINQLSENTHFIIIIAAIWDQRIEIKIKKVNLIYITIPYIFS